MGKPTVLFQSQKVSIETAMHGATAVIYITGVIDEDVNFSIILKHLAGLGTPVRALQLNVRNVARINSCGVREWLLLMEQVLPRFPLVFEDVGEHFIDQANVVPKMLGNKGTSILSFQAPYHCPKCEVETAVSLKPSEIVSPGGGVRPPVKHCPDCGTPLEFDWIPEEYFGFLNRS